MMSVIMLIVIKLNVVMLSVVAPSPCLCVCDFVKHLSLTKFAPQSVVKLIEMIVKNSVTPKAAARHKLLFNKLASVVVLLYI
jgi:hypothetical protein